MTELNSSATPAREVIPLELPLDEVLERVAGDRALLAVLADLHVRESVAALDEMRQLLDNADAARLEQTAHRLAGSLLVFGAADAVRVTRIIEQIASGGHTTDARPHLAALAVEVQRVNAALVRLLRS